MKFKLGQKVKIKEGLIVGEQYYNLDGETSTVFSYGMKELVGIEATVAMIVDNRFYMLDAGRYYMYTDNMLEEA